MILSQKSVDFIMKNVLPNLGLIAITSEDLQLIVDYISDHYEIPLAQAKESGEKIDEDLLKNAASVITEITTHPDW